MTCSHMDDNDVRLSMFTGLHLDIQFWVITGNLIIGFVDSTEIVIEVLNKFRERFPKIHLILREMTTEQ